MVLLNEGDCIGVSVRAVSFLMLHRALLLLVILLGFFKKFESYIGGTQPHLGILPWNWPSRLLKTSLPFYSRIYRIDFQPIHSGSRVGFTPGMIAGSDHRN